MILLNAHGAVFGRLASFAAKKALQGNEVVIVNVEKSIITGSQDDAAKRLGRKLGLRAKGNPTKGPKYSRMPDRVLRRAVRGMLPFRSRRGKEALGNVKVFLSMPTQFEGKQFAALPAREESKIKKHVELGTVCRLLGAKW